MPLTVPGSALECVPKDLRADRELVLVTVTEDGFALKLVSTDLRAYRQLPLAAGVKHGLALEPGPWGLREDPAGGPSSVCRWPAPGASLMPALTVAKQGPPRQSTVIRSELKALVSDLGDQVWTGRGSGS